MPEKTTADLIHEVSASMTVHRFEPEEAWTHQVARFDENAVERAAQALSNHPGTELFDGKMQAFVGHQLRTTPRMLAEWLGARATEVGPDQALEDLARYAKSDSYPARQVMALAGVRVERAYDLTESISLVPFTELEASQQKRLLKPVRALSDRRSAPTAALVKEFQHPRTHLDPESDLPEKLTKLNRAHELETVRLCLSLAGPSGPVRVAKWEEAAEWVPVLGGRYSHFSIQRPLQPEVSTRKQLTEDQIQRAACFIDSFSQTAGSMHDRIQIALERFSSAIQRPSLVDQAIDLGIAIEALLLPDMPDSGEFSFRIRMRAARLLGSNASDRLKIYKLFNHLYTLRSKAVHRGRLSSREKYGRGPKEALQEGFTWMAVAIEKVVEESITDWHEVELG